MLEHVSEQENSYMECGWFENGKILSKPVSLEKGIGYG